MQIEWTWLVRVLGLSILSVLLLSVSVAHGGLRWSGMDPELLVNGDRINVLVEWPDEHTCDIHGEIDTEIGYSKEAEVVLVSESMETFGCGDGSTKLEIRTVSELTDKAKKNRIKLRARMKGHEKFPFRLMVYRNGEFLATCEGETDDKSYKADCGELRLEDGWTRFNGEENVAVGSDLVFGSKVKIKKDTVIGNRVELGDRAHIKKEVRIGNDVSVGSRTKIEDETAIGNGTQIGDEVEIKKKVEIGDDVSVGSRTKIEDETAIGNGTQIGDEVEIKKKVEIGKDAYIGDNAIIEDEAVICDGESIADGTIIGKKIIVGSC